MADEDSEKTEEATQSRRDDFRKRGQVVQSKELASALLLLASAGSIFMLSKFFFAELSDVFRHTLGGDMVQAVRDGDLFTAMKMAGGTMFILIAPVLGISFIIGVGSTVVQTGLLNVEDALSPKLEKLNPLEGFQRIFSLRAVAEALKALLKLVFIGAVVLLILKSEVFFVPSMIQLTAQQMV